jgi:hypothetical protein
MGKLVLESPLSISMWRYCCFVRVCDNTGFVLKCAGQEQIAPPAKVGAAGQTTGGPLSTHGFGAMKSVYYCHCDYNLTINFFLTLLGPIG